MTQQNRDESNNLIANFLKLLFASLDETGLGYCVLRNYDEMPEGIGNDIDMLVHQRELKQFEKILKDIANRQSWVLLKSPKRYGYQSYWFYHEGGQQYVHFDAFTRINWKGMDLIDAVTVLASKETLRQFYIPDPVDEAFISFTKDLIHGEGIKERYYSQITDAVIEYPDKFFAHLKWAVGKPLAETLMRLIHSAEWLTIEAKRSQIQQALFMQRFKHNPLAFCMGAFQFLIIHFRCWLTTPNGIFIALIGPDGSGKSTVSDRLIESLDGLFPATQYYHGRFDIIPDLRTYLNALRKVTGRKKLPPVAGGVDAVHKLDTFSRGRALLYLCYYCFDFILGYGKVFYCKATGRLMIFDRYYYDYFVMDHFSRLPQFIFKTLRFLLPEPDLVIYLKNTPETIHQRKPELTVDQITRQNRACDNIVASLPYAISIVTDMPAEKVVEEIKKEIIHLMAKRWSIK
ncbi:MAG: hypothetical protein RQ866_00630 [Bacteroidales bacterium]|nr:hypothetical protein [Bacteroidales bacterium]